MKQNQFSHENISKKFKSIRSKDFIFLTLTLLGGYAIDGLYGMGHFMAYGISIISGYFIINEKKLPLKSALNTIIVCFFLWHGLIKFLFIKDLHCMSKKNIKIVYLIWRELPYFIQSRWSLPHIT